MACVPMVGSVPETEKKACLATILCTQWIIQKFRKEPKATTDKSYKTLVAVIGCEASRAKFPVHARIPRTESRGTKGEESQDIHPEHVSTPMPARKVASMRVKAPRKRANRDLPSPTLKRHKSELTGNCMGEDAPLMTTTVIPIGTNNYDNASLGRTATTNEATI